MVSNGSITNLSALDEPNKITQCKAMLLKVILYLKTIPIWNVTSHSFVHDCSSMERYVFLLTIKNSDGLVMIIAIFVVTDQAFICHYMKAWSERWKIKWWLVWNHIKGWQDQMVTILGYSQITLSGSTCYLTVQYCQIITYLTVWDRI